MAAIVPLDQSHRVRLPTSPLTPLHPYINSEKRWFKHPSPGLRSSRHTVPFLDGCSEMPMSSGGAVTALSPNTWALSPTPPQTTNSINFLQFQLLKQCVSKSVFSGCVLTDKFLSAHGNFVSSIKNSSRYSCTSVSHLAGINDSWLYSYVGEISQSKTENS